MIYFNITAPDPPYGPLNFFCFHSVIMTKSGPLVARSTDFFGLPGTSKIISSVRERELRCNIWLHSPLATTVEGLYTEINLLDNLVGYFGLVQEINDANYPANPQTFANCVFMGFEPMAIEGQEVPEPVFDFIGHHEPVNNEKRWIQYGQLMWTQQIPVRTSP